ncbi:MAG TPA: hypothetical protein VK488_11035 [Gaiellaceae bacterium]|nr:hypothetical protein [Gaiellaceae bacterium]
MQAKRARWQLLAAATVFLTLAFLAVPTTALADRGNAQPTLSFFSGGHGGHADWLATIDQPPGDTDNQAIRLETTNGAPTYEHGYAGILVHHVTGIPAADFPDSSFWNKTPYPYLFQPYTQGSPRLVVAFQNPAGEFDGYADLRQVVRGNDWEEVSDQTDYPNSAWDVMNTPRGAPCYPFRYSLTWDEVQSCFAGDTTLAVYLPADPYGIYHLIDDVTVNGKTFSSASDNSNGNNDPAGPAATTDPSLLPPLFLLPPL